MDNPIHNGINHLQPPHFQVFSSPLTQSQALQLLRALARHDPQVLSTPQARRAVQYGEVLGGSMDQHRGKPHGKTVKHNKKYIKMGYSRTNR